MDFHGARAAGLCVPDSLHCLTRVQLLGFMVSLLIFSGRISEVEVNALYVYYRSGLRMLVFLYVSPNHFKIIIFLAISLAIEADF